MKKKEIFCFSIVFLFSALINQYYANQGLFPHDSASHFDTGYRILLGDHPVKDYWIVSGFLVDYLQSLFFFLFGTNWQIYVLHASILNGILASSVFYLFYRFNLNIYLNLFFSICFAILAYPTSGTPFVDHHSTFFSLLGLFSVLLGIKTNEKKYWIITPIFLTMGLLCKVVPAIYVIAFLTVVLIYFSIVKKKYIFISYIFYGIISAFFLFYLLLKINDIDLYEFIKQCILYPQSIGAQRFKNFNFSLFGFFSNYKFILISLIPLFLVNFKKALLIDKYILEKKFIYFLLILLFSISLLVHQVLTKNQIFIFFIIPVISAFTFVFIDLKKIFMILIIIFTIFVTVKYHYRFNENRKFHELTNVNLEKSEQARLIDKKLTGLKWITPQYPNEPRKEIEEINQILKILKNEKNNFILLTNYSFLSAVLEINTLNLSRWYIFDGTDHPRANSEFYNDYKEIFIRRVTNNRVNLIYTVKPVNSSEIYDFIKRDCLEETKLTNFLTQYRLRSRICFK